MLLNAAVERQLQLHHREISSGGLALGPDRLYLTPSDTLRPVEINNMGDSVAEKEVTNEQQAEQCEHSHSSNDRGEVLHEDNQPIEDQVEVPHTQQTEEPCMDNEEANDSNPRSNQLEIPRAENQPIDVVQVGSVNRCFINTDQTGECSDSNPINVQRGVPLEVQHRNREPPEVPTVDNGPVNEPSLDNSSLNEPSEVLSVDSDQVVERSVAQPTDRDPIDKPPEVAPLQNQAINVDQMGYVNRCVIHTDQGQNTEVNISYNILPEPPPNAASALDIRGAVRVKIRFQHLNIDETVLQEVQENRTGTQDILKELLFNLMDVRRGCVELVAKPDSPEAVSHLIQTIKDGKLDKIVLDMLKNNAVKSVLDKDKVDVNIDIFIPPELQHLVDVAKSASRPTLTTSASSSVSVVDPPQSVDDLSMDSPSDSLSITTSISTSTQRPRLSEEDIGLQYLFRHIHRRFPRDRLEELQAHSQRLLGNTYGMEEELVTSTLDFLNQLSKRGHVTRNNVTLLWTLMLDLHCPNLLEAVLDYEESVEAQVRDWLEHPDVWTHYGYITCCLSPNHYFLPTEYVQRLTDTVHEATGIAPSHILVRWRTVEGPLSVTMVIVRKVQEAGSKTDLKEELKKLDVDTIEVGADIQNLKTRPEVQMQQVRRWWILDSQLDINRFHQKWKSTRSKFIVDMRNFQAIFSRSCNVMMLGLTGVGKSSCVNSFVAAVTGNGFREISQAGWHGTIVEPVTMSTQRYVNCGVTGTDGNLFPTLFDTMGFPDEATSHLRIVTDRYIGGYIRTEVPTPELLEYAQDHGWLSLQQRYNKYYPEHDVDRIIYVISARQQALPFNHMRVIKETAAGRPIYLLITKTDVDEGIDLDSIKERARNALGIEMDHVFIMINYTDDTTPDRITRMYPALDEANLKILMEICRPVPWDHERKGREEARKAHEPDELDEPEEPSDPHQREERAEPRLTNQGLSQMSRLQQGVLQGTMGLLSLLSVMIAIFLHIRIAQQRFAGDF